MTENWETSVTKSENSQFELNEDININNNNTCNDSISCKSGILAVILCHCLGIFGVHNFYLGRSQKAIYQLLCVFPGVFIVLPLLFSIVSAIVDLIMLLSDNYRDGENKKVIMS